jgi:hypothetical protein
VDNMVEKNSTSLYDTFGNEIKYQQFQGTLIAYLENATVKFPLPEASTDILAKLFQDKDDAIDPNLLDQVEQRLIKSGFKEANAKAMASVIIRVAAVERVNVMDYFEVNSNTLKLTVDTYTTINTLRPVGNRINLVRPLNNSLTLFKDLIKP